MNITLSIILNNWSIGVSATKRAKEVSTVIEAEFGAFSHIIFRETMKENLFVGG